MESNEVQLLEAVFNHLILPPKLPCQVDKNDALLAQDLRKRLQDACTAFRCAGDAEVWDCLITFLAITRRARQESLSKNSLLDAFNLLVQGDLDRWLVLHIVEQNAGLLIHRDTRSEQVIFEVFEASAPTSVVLAANNALQWDFPGRAAAISMKEFTAKSFQDNLSEFLEQASAESFDRFAARGHKAGRSVVEARDSARPALISEMLMSLLEGMGSSTQVCKVHKRIRDDVVLNDAELPWRRSPYWLVLRVASQRVLRSMLGDNGIDRCYFKFMMCQVLCHLLSECVGVLHPEQTLMLQSKLCRRLAKLESERKQAAGQLKLAYNKLLEGKRVFFEETVNYARNHVTNSWNQYKKTIRRPIPCLPTRVFQGDLKLTLPNAGETLYRLFTSHKAHIVDKSSKAVLPSFKEGTLSQINELAIRYSALVDHANAATATLISNGLADSQMKCINLSQAILSYISAVKDAYNGDSQLMSQYLLNLFELWVAMDEAATQACDLLRSYHPIFVPEALDLLCLHTKTDMNRLLKIQRYLDSRIKHSNQDFGTIFSRPEGPFAFAAQYFKHVGQAKDMVALASRIEEASNRSRQLKINQLQLLMGQYHKLTEAIERIVCTCVKPLSGSKKEIECTRCQQKRSRKKLKIEVHEDFLPITSNSNKLAQRSAIVFELATPKYISFYRAATWKLMVLGTPPLPHITGDHPVILLRGVGQLSSFWTTKLEPASITLASRKKSFLQTHYKKLRMPKKASEITLPFGPEFSYYDSASDIWVDSLPSVPWYHHLLGSWLPKNITNPYEDGPAYIKDKIGHPTSYEIIASQLECPSDTSIHEFYAYQRVISGRRRRWLVLLVELGATNMNFSNATTIALLNHVVLQAGPHSQDTNFLREAHVIFEDDKFCQRLVEQLRKRLDVLETSWHETNYMSFVVTLALRLYYLCPPEFQQVASSLLMRIRKMLSDWIAYLRKEVRSAEKGETARKAANHAFWAALLCRQTFSVYYGDDASTVINEENAQYFFNASIALSEHLVVNLQELELHLQHLLRRDLSMSYSMSRLIDSWARSFPNALTDAINKTWVHVGPTKRSYSKWKLPPQAHSGWVTAQTVATKQMNSQAIHYHLIQGHLLIDGKPLGRLPLEMREDPSIQELFGRQHLLTRPSGLPGMEYQLTSDINGHEVHFGFRDKKVLIRVRYKGAYLEYVPRTIFVGSSGTDLPSVLVHDCVHWLDLKKGTVEMRQKPEIWKRKFSNWVLDIRSRMAIRNRKGSRSRLQRQGFRVSDEKLGSCLINPHSNVARQIAKIFEHFEHADNLIIYFPLSATRCFVEIKRLDLQFYINRDGLLQSDQLRAEIDPVQEAGTFHGLASKIILRSVTDLSRKSIIVPIGQVYFQKEGMHVSVKIQNDGAYARFDINHVLGRLDCAPEPLLLYFKALLHASTSFPVPDELTARTGSEESFHCLQSAHSQPWTLLQNNAKRVLSMLQCLAPNRRYYPAGSKIYQQVSWDKSKTMSIQQEQLGVLVDSILEQSQKLEIFQQTAQEQDTIIRVETEKNHLVRRGIIRRQLYERTKSSSDSEILKLAREDVPYQSRDRNSMSTWSQQVYQTVQAIQAGISGVPKLERLDHIIRTGDLIGNFRNAGVVLDIQLLLNTDLLSSWGSLVQSCRSHNASTRHATIFILGLLAFNEKSDMMLIKWLVSQARHPSLQQIEPPMHALFANFTLFEKLNQVQLSESMLRNQSYELSAATFRQKKKQNSNPVDLAWYNENIRDDATRAACALIAKWPNVPIHHESFCELMSHLNLKCMNSTKAWEGLSPELQRLRHNLDLSYYLQRVSEETEKLWAEQTSQVKKLHWHIWHSEPEATEINKLMPKKRHYQLPFLTADLMKKTHNISNKISRIPTVPLSQKSDLTSSDSFNLPLALSSQPKEVSDLNKIINRFLNESEITRQKYGKDLRDSLVALVKSRMAPLQQVKPTNTLNITREISRTQRLLDGHVEGIINSLSRDTPEFFWLSVSNLWPCMSPVAFLEELRSDRITHLSNGMKEALVRYGILITDLQRLLRLRNSRTSYHETQLWEDQSYEGHSNWDPTDHPEWLLLEIDNNLLIRPSQVEVARAIINPSSGKNAVLQMNMGQGKTSCIMPMAVTVLADRKSLCRLVIPKALLFQTAQVIQSRIGGIIGRVIRHIPFARRSPTDTDTLDRYRLIHQNTLESGGVLLCLPDHILSFKLSGLQRLADDQLYPAKQMIEIQHWLERSSRDILDESDFTLSTKTQLIYPSGPQTAVDGHPHRWLIIEEILSLVQKHAVFLEQKFPDGIKVVWRHQGYPILYFLQSGPEDCLNSLLIGDVCNGWLPLLQLEDPTSSIARLDIERIISGVDVSAHDWERAGNSLTDKLFGMRTLYLLRGLISQKILLLCLKKRWNVQYGLHPKRAPLAVPFEAKGVPSQTAEYGHPDTALLLTCLAFYQTGLNMQQISQGLEKAIRADDPAAQFDRWISGCDSLPPTLRQWNLVNSDDETQIRELWEHLRYNRHVINDYMNTFVFPVHAKQFSIKIQASGWDIPLLRNDTNSDLKSSGRNLTTGFSGTNDNKRMLPGTIQQDDLSNLLQTNAEVLCHLLEERNQQCYQMADSDGRHLTEIGLLELLEKKKIRVLIDAGAHILEMENDKVASAWLDIDTQAPGAIYFGSQNEILVRIRALKKSIPLLASPFAENMEKCLVYIDEGHTRGTDLKLPYNAKGAVTLGINQTKDQTVQAAMRLRQLGSTQSVVFMAPPEVYRSIIDLRMAHIGIQLNPSPINSADVIRWLLEQSCKSNEQLMPLHVAQGMDFCRRTNALWKYDKIFTEKDDLTNLLNVMRQREHQTLEQLYGPKTQNIDVENLNFDTPQLRLFAEEIELKQSSLANRKLTAASVFMEVEQEREVEFEVEQVREKQIDTCYTPLKFPGLHKSIKLFISTGYLDLKGPFLQAFEFVAKTKIGKKFGIKKTTSKLFVSEEFTNTIVVKMLDREQHMLRPVEWILWSNLTETALIINPEEADAALPLLRSPQTPQAQLICYAAPVTMSMLAFNSLDYFTVPSNITSIFPDWLKIEIGIVAGRLYFGYSEYKTLLAWLGLIGTEIAHDASTNSSSNLASKSNTSDFHGLQIKNPLQFLQEWLTNCRQTQDITYTPMGFVCQRQSLSASHSFFTSNSNGLQPICPRHDNTANTIKGIREDDEESDDDDESIDLDEEITAYHQHLAQEVMNEEDALTGLN